MAAARRASSAGWSSIPGSGLASSAGELTAWCQRVKLISYATMLATFALSLASGRIAGWALALQAALMAFGAWFIARLPARVPEASERPELLVPRE